MSWDDLRYLESLSRKGNVQAAARELGVSVSTIYRRVAALEIEVGGPCLHKGTDASGLTDTGHRLVSMAREIQIGMGKIRNMAEGEGDGLQGRVGLTTVDAIVPLLQEPLALISAQFPDLCVDLFIGDSGPSVRKHQVEVAIGVMLRPPEELVGKLLFRIEYAVYGTASAKSASSLCWILRGQPIAPSPESDWEDKNAGKAIVRVSTVSSMLSLVLGGLGVALLPKRLAKLHPQLLEMPRYTESINNLVPRDAWLLVHPDTRKNPKVRVLLDQLWHCFSVL